MPCRLPSPHSSPADGESPPGAVGPAEGELGAAACSVSQPPWPWRFTGRPHPLSTQASLPDQQEGARVTSTAEWCAASLLTAVSTSMACATYLSNTVQSTRTHRRGGLWFGARGTPLSPAAALPCLLCRHVLATIRARSAQRRRHVLGSSISYLHC